MSLAVPYVWCLFVSICIADTVTGQGDKPFVSLLCTVLHGMGGLNRGFRLPLRSDPCWDRTSLPSPLLLRGEI